MVVVVAVVMMTVYRSGEAVRKKVSPNCGKSFWKKGGEAEIGTGASFKEHLG